MTTIARPSTPFPHTHTVTHSAQGSSYHRLSLPASYHYATPIHFHVRQLPSPTPPSLLSRTSSSGSSHSGYLHLRRSSSATRPPAEGSDLSRIPSLVSPSPRRTSTSTSASLSEMEHASPSLPVTPSSYFDVSPSDFAHPSPLALPEALPVEPGPVRKGSTGFAMPPPSYNWSDKRLDESTSFDFDRLESENDNDNLSIPTAAVYTPVRPSSRRRDTPRPDQVPTSRSPCAPSRGVKRPFLKRRDTPRPALAATMSSPGFRMETPEEEESDAKRRTLRSALDGGRWIVMDTDL